MSIHSSDAARSALAYFSDKIGKDESNFRDLLTDLMFIAEEDGLDFQHELEIAGWHFEAEMEDEI
jgi:hypothetical protein